MDRTLLILLPGLLALLPYGVSHSMMPRDRAEIWSLGPGRIDGLKGRFEELAFQKTLPARNHLGRLIGPLREYAHNIRGTVYAVDESTIFIKGFTYDGTGPDAFFWVGSTPRPSPEGFIVPYPEDYKGRDPPVLSAFKDVDIILRLPMGKRLRDIKWLSVWCRRFTVDFGEIFIPPSLEVPRPRVLPEFRRLAHGLRSGNVSILDAKTIYIPNLHYDGAGPDAYFWVGNGSEPSPFGIKVPNEMGSLDPLRGYQGEDIEIQLPGNLTVYDIDWLAVWCVQYRHNFGHVMIPKDLDVPPALGQTKITPPWWYNPTTSTTPDPSKDSYGSPINQNETSSTLMSNCRELLDGQLQVQWQMVEGSGILLPPGETIPPPEAVEIQLSGRIREDEYMAFGISGEKGKSSMVGGDVVVAFYDQEKASFRAVDYYMTSKAQCDGKNGVCPDERLGGRDDVTLVSGERRSGITRILYRRPLTTNEGTLDRVIPLRGETSVLAAIGPLNSRKEANAHGAEDKTTEDIRIDFSSRNDHSCRASLDKIASTDDGIKPWNIPSIQGETVFSARIGPTGGKRGYTAITGQPSWGIAWYINDMLIPELYVERGQSYVFMVEGGNDRTNPARYHPFYITDSPEGGFGQKSEQEQRKQRVFAGVGYDAEGYPYPTAAGRYCEWVHKTIDQSRNTKTFEEFFDTLRLMCDDSSEAASSGIAYLNWTVAQETPDLLYYQCYTHNNLGWKIHVVDPGYWSQQNKGSGVYVQQFHIIIIPILLTIFSLPHLFFHSPRLLR
ncbi:protein Skeletor, isoforms B/C-like isoform X1 [Hetaerina americana]|uniref:protein Skeletor, isoforms B/C-like isoform X1 n=1 Tax=Hetaerina americana TaxID=62018 RepID=UPI003A7F5EFC